MTMFRFGCGHVVKDPEVHDASWGARLIYAEVTGSSGRTPVVWDRQTPDGEEAAVLALFPTIDRAIDEFRRVQYELPSDSAGRLCWREGSVLVVMSPQGSYGYLYITAVHERDGHLGETALADFNKETRPRWVELGNWPQAVVDARAAAERKRIEEQLHWAVRDYKWALDDVRRADTPRKRTVRQKKADEIGAHIEELRAIVGYPEEVKA